VEGRGRQAASHLDHAAPRQGCVPSGCEVHLPNYLLSVQMREDKVEVHTSVQVHMREVAGLEQFPILHVYTGLG